MSLWISTSEGGLIFCFFVLVSPEELVTSRPSQLERVDRGAEEGSKGLGVLRFMRCLQMMCVVRYKKSSWNKNLDVWSDSVSWKQLNAKQKGAAGID